jgi:hypothetical protein
MVENIEGYAGGIADWEDCKAIFQGLYCTLEAANKDLIVQFRHTTLSGNPH